MRRPDIRALSEVEREDLAALDRALAGDPLEQGYASLEQVVVALADDAPRLSPAAGELLRRRVDGRLSRRRLPSMRRRGAAAASRAIAPAAGGGGGGRGGGGGAPSRRRSGPSLRWVSRPAVAVAATVLLVVGVGTWAAIHVTSSSSPGSTRQVSYGPDAGPSHAVVKRAAQANAFAQTTVTSSTTTSIPTTTSVVPSAPERAPAPAAGGAAASSRAAGADETLAPTAGALPAQSNGSAAFAGAAAGSPHRQVQHDVNLSLSVAHGHVQAAANGIVAVAERFGGYVASSWVSTGQSVSAQASFTLRMPSDKLSADVDALVHLGNVASLQQNALDITGQVNSAADGLAQDRALRASLLRQLAVAPTLDDQTAIQTRLRRVARRIAGDQSQVAQLHNRATFDTVAVTVYAAAAQHKAKPKPAAAHWSANAQLRHALRLLEHTVTAILLVLAVAGPLLVLIVLAWLAAAVARRRRREQALRAV